MPVRVRWSINTTCSVEEITQQLNILGNSLICFLSVIELSLARHEDTGDVANLAPCTVIKCAYQHLETSLISRNVKKTSCGFRGDVCLNYFLFTWVQPSKSLSVTVRLPGLLLLCLFPFMFLYGFNKQNALILS